MKTSKGCGEQVFRPTAHAGFWGENIAESLSQRGESRLCAVSSKVGHGGQMSGGHSYLCGPREGAEGRSHVRGGWRLLWRRNQDPAGKPACCAPSRGANGGHSQTLSLGERHEARSAGSIPSPSRSGHQVGSSPC